MKPTPEDVRAAARMLGYEPVRAPLFAARRSWSVQSATQSGKYYLVEERPDTIYGGTYLHCTCPSWGPAYGSGRYCKHILAVQPDAVIYSNGRP